MHQGTEGDVDFYRSVCTGVKTALELGVGAGRIAAALAKDGVRVTGVEQDAAMIALGKRKHPSPRITWVQADMRALDLGRRFPRVLLPYNGLFTLPSDADVVACFEAAARHLTEDGYLVFDFWVADDFHREDTEADESGWDAAEEEREPVGSVRYQGRMHDVFESTTWTREQQRVDASYRYVPRDGGTVLVSEVMSRYVLTTQLDGLLAAAGLEVLVRHGGFDQSAWDEDCDRMIVTARRSPAAS
ncbi:MAG: class I SAM-dependent methyltransferase [Sandaracinaceae bacterium]|nr:class I SAM-dependent methyltransferase [Sandaracinaceae bacterium]MBK8406874.1 class I SAM-dependent methyltransferase [Sandaracinaceae bacterium]